jgi:hypothetical protein
MIAARPEADRAEQFHRIVPAIRRDHEVDIRRPPEQNVAMELSCRATRNSRTSTDTTSRETPHAPRRARRGPDRRLLDARPYHPAGQEQCQLLQPNRTGGRIALRDLRLPSRTASEHARSK